MASPRNRSISPQDAHPHPKSHRGWILDSKSGLYWNSSHRVWAKYEDEKWTYADQDGNLIENPDDADTKATSSNPKVPGAERIPEPHHSKNQRAKVTYQDVYEEEEGELACDQAPQSRRSRDRFPRPATTNREEENEQEEGELDSVEEALLDFHDSIPAPAPPRPFPLRLLASFNPRSTAPDPNRNLLILQPGVDEPMVLGRDRTFEPSLRLKEMEVSKTHATLFWRADGELASHGWHVVDNASTHGTFISTPDTHPGATSTRLSKARKASLPYKLKHLDTIQIASTEDPVISLQVHLHARFPSSCQSCALFPDESNRMSLELQHPAAAQEASKSTEGRDEERYAMSPAEVKVERERKRKMEMAKLKNHFFGDGAELGSKKLKRPERPPSASTDPLAGGGEEEMGAARPVPKPYLDRAKLRRQTHGRSAVVAAPPSDAVVGPSRAPETQEPESMARGSALLAKLGGNSDSLKTMGSLIEARSLGHSQAGLGSRQLVVGVENISRPKDWRQEAKLANWRRYESSKPS
ncbi:hypothetical protein PCANC_21021 [Puccinia coronata f. sp. avenae]|uniref:FHA domain-containing protein n=1 Tax=Puccinia coronata f. sp. avenae TaxID=200324 RepID=A0A2N5U272_9BASI|nr:hypothetical protein PCANC_21021 [Puccinia coronata f. sp. avenae]